MVGIYLGVLKVPYLATLPYLEVPCFLKCFRVTPKHERGKVFWGYYM